MILFLRYSYIKSSSPFANETVVLYDTSILHLQLKCTDCECTSGIMSSDMWKGDFHFSVIINENEIIKSGPFYFIFEDRNFTLNFNDYNNDGNLDFAIGSFGSVSGGNTLFLYTINSDGSITELPFCTKYPQLRFAPDRSPSPILQVESNTSFSTSHMFDSSLVILLNEQSIIDWLNNHGYKEAFGHANIKNIFEWRNGEFELVRQELIEQT